MSQVPVGDQGQRYEVSFYDPHTCMRQVLGWTDHLEGVQALTACINLHPRWEQPEVKDRQNASGPEHLAPQPAVGLEFDARGVLVPTDRVKLDHQGKTKVIKKKAPPAH